ncbi:MAG: transketolase [Cytophagaceae bacterium]|nr:transketolase [Cytophagaceae bacterium]|tara:strand:- start:7213 stop:8058 length:846 start_codon:yes stop_codon:yes gene_type:complete
MPNIKELEDLVTQVRRDIVRQVHACQSGHPGGSLGCAEFMVALYFEVMDRKEGFDMDGTGEDLFFLSNGHISPVWYSVLARAGYFPIEELSTFRQLNSRLQGHPTTHEGLPGIRIASGSLGQGMSVALGAAEAKKHNGDKHIIYSLHGDGELQEGQNWEAIMYAGAKNVDNLISTVDRNWQQIDGTTKEVLDFGDIGAKFNIFGWDVIEVEEGNNLEKIIEALNEAKSRTGRGKPICIVLHSAMGHGVDYMLNNHKWHGSAPNDEQLEDALAQNPVTLGDY